MVRVLRDRCFQMLRYLAQDVRIPFTRIGKYLGLSHTAVRKCYLTLLRDNIIRPALLLHHEILSPYLILLHLRTRYLPTWLHTCPRVLYVLGLDDTELLLIVLSERRSLLRLLEERSCFLTSEEWVRDFEVREVKFLEPPHIYPKLLLQSSTLEKSPCGAVCSTCPHRGDTCPGCPVSRWYSHL